VEILPTVSKRLQVAIIEAEQNYAEEHAGVVCRGPRGPIAGVLGTLAQRPEHVLKYCAARRQRESDAVVPLRSPSATFAQRRVALQHSCEYRFKIAERAADYRQSAATGWETEIARLSRELHEAP
jgi:hypothetical protein